jgi:hypothetical protein
VAIAAREVALQAAGLRDISPLEYAVENALKDLRQIERNTTPDFSRLSTRAGLVLTSLREALLPNPDWDVTFKTNTPRNLEGCRNRSTGDVIFAYNTCANTGHVTRPDLLPQFICKRSRPATVAQLDFCEISDDFSFSTHQKKTDTPSKRHILCIYFGETRFDGLKGEIVDVRAELVVNAVCNSSGIISYEHRLPIELSERKGDGKSNISNFGPDGDAIAVEPVIRKRE